MQGIGEETNEKQEVWIYSVGKECRWTMERGGKWDSSLNNFTADWQDGMKWGWKMCCSLVIPTMTPVKSIHLLNRFYPILEHIALQDASQT